MRYQLYNQRPKAVRYLSYPTGLGHLVGVLERFRDSEGAGSLSARILDQVQLGDGCIYLTVPFCCPEDIRIDGLEWGQFYSESNESRQFGDQHLDEVVTTDTTNQAILEQVLSGDYVLAFERGTERVLDPNQNAALGRAFSASDGSDVLRSACLDSSDELRFLFRCEPQHQFEPQLNSLSLIACYIFDWTGYLLWFPKVIERG